MQNEDRPNFPFDQPVTLHVRDIRSPAFQAEAVAQSRILATIEDEHHVDAILNELLASWDHEWVYDDQAG